MLEGHTQIHTHTYIDRESHRMQKQAICGQDMQALHLVRYKFTFNLVNVFVVSHAVTKGDRHVHVHVHVLTSVSISASISHFQLRLHLPVTSGYISCT